MCGIAGIVYVRQKSPASADLSHELRAAANSLRHRGPDDEGIWINEKGNVGLAQRRLSILDLSTNAPLPMRTDEGALTYNGEIYNYRALRSELGEANFVTDTDTEVLLAGLLRNGADYIPRLDGMFAFGLYSQSNRSLTLAVDPAGEKPVYTYWDGRVFAFASELKALWCFSAVREEIDRGGLQRALVYGYVPWPNTAYRYVRKLPAGRYQIISTDNGPNPTQTYWDLPKDINYSLREKDARAELRELLGRAVRKRLIADVPVGCFLSGGLDSSAVTLEAVRALPPNSFPTFVAGYARDTSDRFYDETNYAELVSKKLGTIHQTLRIDPGQVDAAEIMRHFGEPFGDSSAIPTYLLCREAARHVKVVLSGDGGDELFGGYLRFCGGLLSERYQTLWQWGLLPVRFLDPAPYSLLAKVKRFQTAVSLPLLKRLAVWNSFFSEEELHTFFGESRDQAHETLLRWDEQTRGLPIGEKILHYNFKTYLFDDLLPKMDRMSMAHGLEVRSPFLDKELIEFAFRLPTSFKFDAFRTKKILKNAYRPELGAKITDRAKHGFAFPLENFPAIHDREPNSPLLRKFFPHASLHSSAINPLNRVSKKFVLWTMEQNLQYAR